MSAAAVPVVVVVRHPDSANEVTLYECEAAVIDIDLGSSFDAAQLDDSTRAEVAEWAWGLRELANRLPVLHRARLDVRDIVREILTERQAVDWTHCSRCRVRYDEGRGDGYCGLCPACADATEPADCDECGEPGVDPTAKGADGRSVCDDCRDAATEGVVD